MGGYTHAKVKPNARILKILYKYFTWRPIGQTELAQWIRSGNQHIVFIAIKEYISFAVNMVPGLEAVLVSTYPWTAFYSGVIEHADLYGSYEQMHARRHIFHRTRVNCESQGHEM